MIDYNDEFADEVYRTSMSEFMIKFLFRDAQELDVFINVLDLIRWDMTWQLK